MSVVSSQTFINRNISCQKNYRGTNPCYPLLGELPITFPYYAKETKKETRQIVSNSQNLSMGFHQRNIENTYNNRN